MDNQRKNTIIEIDYEEIGKRIRQRRKSMNISQTELAETLDVSKYHISHIECGKSSPSLELIVKLSFRLNTTPDYLLLGTIKASNAPLSIVDSLKLCSEEDLKIISDIIYAFLKNRKREESIEYDDSNL